VRMKTRLLAVAGTLAISGSMIAIAAPAANAVVTPAGQCTGARVKGVLTPALGDQTVAEKVTTSIFKDLSTIPSTTLGGTCTGTVVPFGNPGGAVPATLHPKALATTLTGIASCASGAADKAVDATSANAYPLNGKQVITMNESDALAKPWQIQTYLTVEGFDTTPGVLDVVHVAGIVIKGPSVGATLSGSFYEDPQAKILPPLPNPKPAGFTGYQLDLVGALGCADGVANTASIGTVEIGNGTSPICALLLTPCPSTGEQFNFPGV